MPTAGLSKLLGKRVLLLWYTRDIELGVSINTRWSHESAKAPLTLCRICRVGDRAIDSRTQELTISKGGYHVRGYFDTTQQNPNFALWGICGLLAIAAALVGIDDNLPGILLALLAAIALVLAFVHPWRTSRQFRRLLYASALGFVIFGVLSNVFEAIALKIGSTGPMQDLLNGAGAVFFLMAILICPAGLLVGAVGAVVMSIRNRRRPPSGFPTAA